jgi:hypothetical protein
MSENDTENGPIEHVFKLLVEIEPLGPGVEVLTASAAAHVVVAATVVDPRLGEAATLAELVEDRTRPPVEVRVDDVHGLSAVSAGDSSILEHKRWGLKWLRVPPLPEREKAPS